MADLVNGNTRRLIRTAVQVRRAMKINPGVSIELPNPKDIIRFLSKIKIDHEGGCWLWNGTLDPKGYGMIRVAGKTLWVHRFAMAVFRSADISGLEVNHICRCRNCVNPTHLNMMTHGENSADANRHRKTGSPEARKPGSPEAHSTAR